MTMLPATNTQARVVPRVLEESCRACWTCPARRACRTKALLQLDRGEAPFVDAALCYGCHACLPACPFGAICVE